MKSLKSSSILLLLILLSGFLLRLVVLAVNDPQPHYNLLPGMDEVNYRELASNILQFHSYSAWSEGFFTSSTRSPVYPLLLASFQRLTGGSLHMHHMLNLLLDTLSIVLVFAVAGRMFGRRVALLSSGVYAFFGAVFIYLPLSTYEILSVFLLLSVVLCLLQFRDEYGYTVPLFALLYALLIHTKPVFLLTIPFVGLAIFVRLNQKGTFKCNLLKALFPLLLTGLLCLPWGIRNYDLHHTAVPVCTIGAWHLYTRAHSMDNLPVKVITDYAYAPERNGYSEGDYYREGMSEFWDIVLENPFRLPFYGSLLLLKNWTPPRPFYRFLLPKAYVIPIVLWSNVVIPLPDFEGLFYIFILLNLFALCMLKGKWFVLTREWFIKSAPVVIFIAAYLLAHIMGVPLIQYRFTVEPLLLILGLGLIVSFTGDKTSEFVSQRTCRYLILGVLLFMVVFMLIPLLYRDKILLIDYPERSLPEGCVNYLSLRNKQWENLGSIPEDTRLAVSGVVKYPVEGVCFKSDMRSAVSLGGGAGCVAKLYVYLFDRDSPMGIGDIKVNFRGIHYPSEGDVVYITGKVSNGIYKEVIVDVEQWQTLLQVE